MRNATTEPLLNEGGHLLVFCGFGCRKALVFMEDRKFFDHPGIDIWGILRAISVGLVGGDRAQEFSIISITSWMISWSSPSSNHSSNDVINLSTLVCFVIIAPDSTFLFNPPLVKLADVTYAATLSPMYIFAWNFSDSIIKKHKRYLNLGGKFIIPFPKLQIISN